MIRFILNKKEIETALPPGILLLDFIRYHQNLTGTKIGCREGDCGACTILVGEIKNGNLKYSNATSCLMAIGNAQGKHIVTVEGINLTGLNAVQQAFADEGATQCGFCTPGFIVSMAGYCINDKLPSYSKAIEAINGNICRCTGYKSIERAAQKINTLMEERVEKPALQFAVDNNIIPAYFLSIKEKLHQIKTVDEEKINTGKKILGGGTDLYVQQHETMPYENISFLFDKKEMNGITKNGNTCEMGAATTVTDMAESEIFSSHFKNLSKYIYLISSLPIRNMATLAGNFSNASPIGDLTVFFLALNAQLHLTNENEKRIIALQNFYKGYKILDKLPEEIIEKISFELPAADDLFNFEKVCKRTCLDIASVNTAIHLKMKEGKIVAARLSAGGVGPIPTYLLNSSEFLKGKEISEVLVHDLINIAQTEIVPISDARGTKEYKRLLLSQLIKAHFITLFPTMQIQTLISISA
ncbi:MAG: FAD binding domain-containing protein [Ferruginibacter sp.]|nr:FAD binding domain-containing protein [Ferruginibacter sp.]